MDDCGTLGSVHHDQLQQAPGSIRPNEQITACWEMLEEGTLSDAQEAAAKRAGRGAGGISPKSPANANRAESSALY